MQVRVSTFNFTSDVNKTFHWIILKHNNRCSMVRFGTCSLYPFRCGSLLAIVPEMEKTSSIQDNFVVRECPRIILNWRRFKVRLWVFGLSWIEVAPCLSHLYPTFKGGKHAIRAGVSGPNRIFAPFGVHRSVPQVASLPHFPIFVTP